MLAWTDVIVANLPYLMKGLLLTLRLTAIAMIGSLVVGTLLVLARMSQRRWLRWPAIAYIDVLRMIPLVMVIFWMFFLLPILTGHAMPPELAIIGALVFYNASYIAEVLRAGIEAVPKGLSEAARSSGFGYIQTMRFIILPLAFSYMLPALVTRLISVFMGTSLAYVIGVPEFFRSAYNLNSRVFQPYEIFCFVALVYFVFCYGLSLLGEYLQRRLPWLATAKGGGLRG